MSDSIVGIDVSKESLDANCARGQRKQSRTFENSPDGWKLMLAWFTAMGSTKAHVCMEATGRHSLGVALALHDAGHIPGHGPDRIELIWRDRVHTVERDQSESRF